MCYNKQFNSIEIDKIKSKHVKNPQNTEQTFCILSKNHKIQKHTKLNLNYASSRTGSQSPY